MKKKLYISIILILTLFLTGCGNNYQGYWCNYDETATIVVLLNRNNTEKERTKIEAKIDTFENVESSNYYSREDYAEELGENINDLDIYDTYVILFSSMDSIGTYIDELNSMKGVKNAEQSNAKTNLSLYNLKSWGKYTYAESDEALEEDIETGKYKIKNGVITFTPDKKGKTRLLYTKSGLLCKDADCQEIYAKSNATCTTK